MTQPPSILFVLPWKISAVTGVNQVVLNLARETYKHDRLRPIILCNNVDQENFQITDLDGIPLVNGHLHAPITDHNPARNLAAFALSMHKDLNAWGKFFKKHNVKVVNAHHAFAGYTLFSLMRALKLAKVRLVYSLYGSDIDEMVATGPTSRAAGRWMIKQADRIVCCSENLSTHARGALKIDNHPVDSVLNGIDPETLEHAKKLTYRPNTGKFDDYLINVAAFVEEKDQSTLLSAYRQLVDEGVNTALVLIGRKTPYIATLRSKVKRAGLEDHVFFVTDLDHSSTLAAMRKARLMVQPSREESCNLPLIEAAYLRTPIVATNSGGTPEVLGGYYPYLVQPGDPNALARCIDDALFNPTETNRQRRLLKRRIAARFTWQRAYQDYLPIWLDS